METKGQISTININGTELHYLEAGQGPAVIFVHGSLGDWRTWNFQIEPFSKEFHIVSYSRRYHYPNKWGSDGSDYSVALHAQDLSALINKLNLAPVHIIGTSFGAYVSLYMTSRIPGAVKSLVIGEPPVLPWLEQIPDGNILFQRFMKNAFGPARRAFSSGNMEEGVSCFLDGVIGEGAFNRLSEKVKEQMMENAPEMKAETTSENFFSELTFSDMEKINCPVLLLTGERSPRMFHMIIDQLEKLISRCKKIEVPNCSHSMQTGNAQFYNNVVLQFLKEQEKMN